MELRQLEYFEAICEELHFTRAAEKLGITQPTLSHQIKSLEGEIGVQLFDRLGKRIELTEAGAILREQSAIIFTALKNAKEQILELNAGERGMLSIGCLPGELNHMVSSLLVEFNRNSPRIQIRIVAAENLIERIFSNELDVAVTIMPIADERIEKIPLYFEQFYLTVSSDHPLANREFIAFEEVKEFPLILFPQNHKCRQLIDITCNTSGVQLIPFIETNTIDSIINLVKSNAGASILSKSLLDLHNDASLKAVKIVSPTLCRQIVMIYRRDKFLSRAAKAFIALMKKHVSDNRIGDQVQCDVESFEL
ncbi:LysR family transcriptional regulator [Cohnella lupini]|uniref:DNA-binding transcriptional LysR family regulator n=1 Tax=Cohnella lupini TaxID=1294267 RepID=A0A3D9ICL5_9BACL|nr:LysR family transcriptional regulator [Cohnella lupini]RED59395.1 DNA-binding transcriptional LysR family regulator [Cohnella lupini]